jgi:hypothetical protein
LELSYREYEKMMKFIEAFKKEKGFKSDKDLPKGMQE